MGKPTLDELSVSQNGQFHGLDVTYTHMHTYINVQFCAMLSSSLKLYHYMLYIQY